MCQKRPTYMSKETSPTTRRALASMSSGCWCARRIRYPRELMCHELTVPRHLYAYGVLAYGHMHCKMSAPTSVTNSRATNSLYRATCVYMSCTRTHTYTHTHIHTSYPVPTGDKLFTIYFVCVVKYTETHDTLDIVRTPYAYNTHIIHRIEHADHDTLPIRYTLPQFLCVIK